MVLRIFSLIVLVVGATSSTSARAQDTVALTTGFTPDPLIVLGVTEGARPINEIAPGCRGYVGSEPDLVVDLESRFSFLRFFVMADADLSMAVRDPRGRWHCSGRPLEEAPREEGSFERGRVEVWIGSTRLRAEVPYELRVTEFRSVTPATGALEEVAPVGGGDELGLNVTGEAGSSRGRRLRRGFLPDPREDGGSTTGGTVDVRTLGGSCQGLVDVEPNHVLTLRNDLDYFRVQLGNVPGGATLIVRTPGGRWFCDAPDETNARVERDAWPEGDYRIWVGTPDGAELAYRICYTEVRPALDGSIRCGDRELNVFVPAEEASEESASSGNEAGDRTD